MSAKRKPLDKHSIVPGPWVAKKDPVEGGYQVIRDDESNEWPRVYRPVAEHIARRDEARAIAAVPELREVVIATESLLSNKWDHARAVEVVGMARAALAKARGES